MTESGKLAEEDGRLTDGDVEVSRLDECIEDCPPRDLEPCGERSWLSILRTETPPGTATYPDNCDVLDYSHYLITNKFVLYDSARY